MRQIPREILIVVFDASKEAHREAFAALNRVWLERHFAVEPHDLEQLYDAETHILNGGGRIFLASAGETIVGTVALIASGTGSFEMAKMSVADSHKGQGIGRRLCDAALAWARSTGASYVWLESNRRLTPALGLYESVGFREVPLSPSPYARADIKMELRF